GQGGSGGLPPVAQQEGLRRGSLRAALSPVRLGGSASRCRTGATRVNPNDHARSAADRESQECVGGRVAGRQSLGGDADPALLPRSEVRGPRTEDPGGEERCECLK